MVVPRVGPALGASAHDLPARAEFEADVERRTRALGDSHNPDDPTFTAFKAEVLARQGVARVEDLPTNYNGVLMAEGERLTTDAYRQARAGVAAALARQDARVALTGVLSPYVAMRLASMALSGGGTTHANDFERQAEDYRYDLVQVLEWPARRRGAPDRGSLRGHRRRQCGALAQAHRCRPLGGRARVHLPPAAPGRRRRRVGGGRRRAGRLAGFPGHGRGLPAPGGSVMGVVFRLELLRVLRSRALVAAMAVWAVAAAAALVNGERIIERQRRVLAQSDLVQGEQHAAVLAHQPATGSAGDQLYYLAFHTRHHPSSWASLSIGQRDQRSFNLKVRALALHGQLYDGDLTNPLLAALGTFDFAFVLVALVPLLVVALCHDLISGEREAGTWPLVKAQPAAPLMVLGTKVSARYAVLLTLVSAVVVAAPLATGAPWDARVPTLILLMAVYLLAWVSVSMLVATLGRPSDVNALVLLGVWVLLVVVGPALAVMAGAARHPTPEALELTVAQRQGYHASWDRPVPETMAPFVARYPQWASAPVPTDRYSTAWYYAMQQRGDDEATPAAAAYRDALVARQAWVARWLRLFPPADVQRAIDRMARTDLPAHLAYLDSVASFHEGLTRHFLPVMFREPTIGEVDWRHLPRHDHVDEGVAGDLLPASASVTAWALLWLALTWARRARL